MRPDITNNMVKTEFYICADNLDFDYVLSHLNISISNIRKKEDFPIKEYAKDYWYVETEYQNSNDINEQLSTISMLVSPKKDIINEISKRFRAQCGFNIVIKREKEPLPAIYFESDFVNLASKINASINLDII